MKVHYIVMLACVLSVSACEKKTQVKMVDPPFTVTMCIPDANPNSCAKYCGGKTYVLADICQFSVGNTVVSLEEGVVQIEENELLRVTPNSKVRVSSYGTPFEVTNDIRHVTSVGSLEVQTDDKSMIVYARKGEAVFLTCDDQRVTIEEGELYQLFHNCKHRKL